jgi:UDP-4-amino-4,6-dideoxy-N-acetyl-beta-L-altrosamine N-acetyltransferase
MIDLRPVSSEDRQRLFDWRKDPSVDRWMSDVSAPSQGLHDFWFDNLLTNPDLKGWIIGFRGEPVGFLSLTGLLGTNRRAEWGWYVASAEARGRGVGRAAQALGLDLAMDQCGLEKVWALVLADNDAALRAQAAAGFRREGYLRHHILKDGVFRDVAILGILSSEWSARRHSVRRNLIEAGLIPA